MKKTGESRQLSAGDKVKIILWLNAHREWCENKTALELADEYKKENGIDLSISTILTYRREIFPELRNGGILLGMITALTKRIEILELFKRSLE